MPPVPCKREQNVVWKSRLNTFAALCHVLSVCAGLHDTHACVCVYVCFMPPTVIVAVPVVRVLHGFSP